MQVRWISMPGATSAMHVAALLQAQSLELSLCVVGSEASVPVSKAPGWALLTADWCAGAWHAADRVTVRNI